MLIIACRKHTVADLVQINPEQIMLVDPEFFVRIVVTDSESKLDVVTVPCDLL